MDYLIVKKLGDGTKLYLDREGSFRQKSLAYPMPRWVARVIWRTCFNYGHKVHIEEAR